jgi:hypothetical protein
VSSPTSSGPIRTSNLQLDAQDSKSGQTKRWLVECASTSILNRAGWRFNLIKAGDKVTVIVSPLRNGEPAALLKQIVLADGTKLSNGAAAGARRSSEAIPCESD